MAEKCWGTCSVLREGQRRKRFREGGLPATWRHTVGGCWKSRKHWENSGSHFCFGGICIPTIHAVLVQAQCFHVSPLGSNIPQEHVLAFQQGQITSIPRALKLSRLFCPSSYPFLPLALPSQATQKVGDRKQNKIIADGGMAKFSFAYNVEEP